MTEDIIRDWLRAVSADRAVQSILEKSAVIATDVGLTRNENQDRVAALQVQPPLKSISPFICIAISDGMGGMRDGAECATLTLSAFFRSLIQAQGYDPNDRLKTAASTANNAVNEYAHGNGGATLSAVLIEPSGIAHYVNVGDLCDTRRCA